LPFTQQIAPLPARRVTPSFAFENVGFDLAGPFTVLVEKYTDEEEEKERFAKVWVILFTCCISRAVHLEYTPKVTTQHVLNGIQRFIARRGVPRTITCDNALQFHKIDRELKRLYQALNWEKIQKHAIEVPTRIDFIFNAPLAPHWAGFYERMVGSVKKALKSSLGARRATLEEFRTLLVNAECVVNSRPLSACSDDARDPLPITPAHLVLGKALSQLPDDLSRDDLYTKAAMQLKERSKLHSEIWGRWRKEYLTALQAANKWLQPGKEPRIGEVVLIGDTPPSRMMWPLGTITEIHKGRDGRIRMVDLWTTQKKPLKRDIRYLYRLEEACSK
jgi:hypothetical protein